MIDLKTKIFIIIGIVLIGIIIYLLNHQPRPTDTTAVENAKYYKDINGKLIATIKQKDITELEMKTKVDSLAHALKIKPKFIKGVDRYDILIDTVLVDSTSIVLQGKDTAYKVEKHDAWLDAVAIAGKDSGSISLKMRDTLTRVEKVKNPWFGPTTREVVLRNASPYSVIQSGYSFVIKEKRAILTVGPYLGIDIKGKPSFGLAVQFPIIQVKR